MTYYHMILSYDNMTVDLLFTEITSWQKCLSLKVKYNNRAFWWMLAQFPKGFFDEFYLTTDKLTTSVKFITAKCLHVPEEIFLQHLT